MLRISTEGAEYEVPPPLNRRFVVFFHNHRGIMFESFYIVSWLWATTNIDNIQLRNKKESKKFIESSYFDADYA